MADARNALVNEKALETKRIGDALDPLETTAFPARLYLLLPVPFFPEPWPRHPLSHQHLPRAWLFLLAVLVKVIPSLLFVCNRISLKDSVRLGVLLCSRLSLIIVAATIGLKAGFITQEFKDTIILLALITCLLGPTGFKLISPSEKTSKQDGPKIRREKMPAGWMR